MRRDRVRGGLTVVALAGIALVLLRLAWLPGVGLGQLPRTLEATSPDRSLPLVLALAMASFVLSLAPPVRAAQPAPPEAVTLRPGDWLWRVAARALPRGASTALIERSWHRWYATNRAVIGPDPGLIQPGQHLTAPTP